MRPYKICHLSTMTQYGGVERSLIDLFNYPKTLQFDHVLCMTSSSPDLLLEVAKSGIVFLQPKRRFRYDPLPIAEIVDWLSKQKVDILHSYNAYANSWANFIMLFSDIQNHVVSERGTIWKSKPPISWLDRWSYLKAKAIVTNSQASKKLIINKYKIPKDKIHVVYNPIARSKQLDRAAARSELNVGNKFVVGSIGRLAKQKGYEVFLQSAKKILNGRSDVIFVIIGGGKQADNLKKLSIELGINDQVVFTGWLANAREILPAFDVFVSTSIYEPFGNVFIEAAIAGVPIIAPKVDGIPEAVGDGVNGKLLIPKNEIDFITELPQHVLINGKLTKPHTVDHEELADTIIEFLDNDELRKKFAKAGMKRVESFCTLERYCSELETIYQRVLSNR